MFNFLVSCQLSCLNEIERVNEVDNKDSPLYRSRHANTWLKEHTSEDVPFQSPVLENLWPECDVFRWCPTFILCFKQKPNHPLIRRSAVIAMSLPAPSLVPLSYTTASKIHRKKNIHCWKKTCCCLDKLNQTWTAIFLPGSPSRPMTVCHLSHLDLPFLVALLLQGVNEWHEQWYLPWVSNSLHPARMCTMVPISSHSLHSGSSLIPQLGVWLVHVIGSDSLMSSLFRTHMLSKESYSN